jgi:hypothetical protein
MHPPTEEQQEIINFARHKTENLCVNALDDVGDDLPRR